MGLLRAVPSPLRTTTVFGYQPNLSADSRSRGWFMQRRFQHSQSEWGAHPLTYASLLKSFVYSGHP